LRNIIASAKIILVPIREMADVLSVESKSVDLSRDSWVRMKLGVYKGDLAKVRSLLLYPVLTYLLLILI
jgi:transcription elongation factor SPT5